MSSSIPLHDLIVSEPAKEIGDITCSLPVHPAEDKVWLSDGRAKA